MSSFFLLRKPLNQALAVCFAGDPVEIIRLVLFVSVYMPQHRSLYSGCEDLLSVHFTEPTYLAPYCIFWGEDLPVGY
jgi:hypothetical protein